MAAPAAETAQNTFGAFAYPETARKVVVDTYHGETKIEDAYRWLEDPDSAETVEWTKQQNAVTNKVLETCDTRDKIKARLTELMNFERYSCPSKKGSRYIFSKNDGLQNQSVMYKQDSLDSEPSVLLDPNLLSADGTAALGVHRFSEDGELLAYGISRSGSDWVNIHVRNVASAEDLKDKLEWVKFSSISWTHDNKGFFYSRYPTPKAFKGKEDEEFARGSETDAMKNQQVYYHLVGQDQSEDVLVFSTPEEPNWMSSAHVSDDGCYLTITLSDSCDPVNRLYYADLNKAKSAAEAKGLPLFSRDSLDIVKLVDNFEAEYGYITNEGTRFWFKTNLDAPRYRVICIDVANPAKENWSSVIPQHESDVLNMAMCIASDKLLACYMHNVKEVLLLFDLEGKMVKGDFELPAPGQIVGLSGHKKHTEVFYKFTSFLYPGTAFHWDVETGATRVFRETKVKGFDATQFEAKQVWFESKDKTRVPMFVVERKDAPRNSDRPTLLYGYGGFNISLLPNFSVSRLIFVLNLGGLVAIPNLRGGGEFGEEWHQAGTLTNKQNVFDDFQCAAEYLIAEKYTSPAKLCIHGGSNGGLLVGACLNQRPDLYACGVAAVGVLDMLRFHKFTIGYAWCSDYGNADDEEHKEQFDALLKYSPYHNVPKDKDVIMPHVMLTTADHDDRVVPLHSFKYIAELQHQVGRRPEQKHPLLIRVEVKAGHGAGKPLSKRIDELGDVYGFMAKAVGAKWIE